MKKEIYHSDCKKWFTSLENIENTFRWLITIGILRREVDGQGLTNKIRLTPLGRNIFESQPSLPNKRATFMEKIQAWASKKSLIL